MFLRKLLGYGISRIILPVQNKEKKPFPQSSQEVQVLSYVSMSPQSKIVFSEFTANPSEQIQNEKIMICLTGNLTYYEDKTEEYKDLAKNFQSMRVVAFNMRGVSNSEGSAYSEEDWIDDTINVINRYRNQGVPTENILLNGHDLGGTIATLAAAKLYEQDKKKNRHLAPSQVRSVCVISDRSFSNLPSYIVHSMIGDHLCSLILTTLGTPLLSSIGGMKFWMAAPLLLGSLKAGSFLYKGLSARLLEPFVSAFLWCSFGTLNTAKAYKKLPTDAKDYLVAKTDPVIGKEPSLHRAIKSERSKLKAEFLREKIFEHGGWLYKGTMVGPRFDFVNLKDSKLVVNELEVPKESNSHTLPLYNMSTSNKIRREDQLLQMRGSAVLENKMKRLLKLSR